MKGMCWKCGQERVLRTKYGYPVCAKCGKALDPEAMEVVVIDAYRDGEITPLDKRDKAD